MATAKKLPSGSYRCRVYAGKENGKDIYKSFTAPTKKEAERLAAEYLCDEKPKGKENQAHITFKIAMETYIRNRENVLSPSTIKGYWKLYRGLSNWYDKPVNKITAEDIQILVNDMAKDKAPKTVLNYHGFIVSTMHLFRPDMVINTALPQRKPCDIYIPTEYDMKKLLETAEKESDEIYNAILLGAFGGMRRSEICAAEKKDIQDGLLHINKAMVETPDGGYTIKLTKSVAGDRFIALPDFVFARFSHCNGRLVNINPYELTKAFRRVLALSELPHFRFHDLRHYCVSIQHALGIPDQYIMDYVGHSSTDILQKVYRHSMTDQEKKMDAKRQEYFAKFENV